MRVVQLRRVSCCSLKALIAIVGTMLSLSACQQKAPLITNHDVQQKQSMTEIHTVSETYPAVKLTGVNGIYVSHQTSRMKQRFKTLLSQAKQHHINSMVIDFVKPTKRAAVVLKAVRKAGIHPVARIVMYPHGGLHEHIVSKPYLIKRLNTIKQALILGYPEIQLDYIRYKHTQPASSENAKCVHEVIKAVKHLVDAYRAKLQIDIFGVAAHGESPNIGQDPKLFASSVHAICPMVYPSHYHPYAYHSKRPYETIRHSVSALKKIISGT